MCADEIKCLAARFRQGAEIALSKGEFKEQPLSDLEVASLWRSVG